MPSKPQMHIRYSSDAQAEQWRKAWLADTQTDRRSFSEWLRDIVQAYVTEVTKQ